MGPQRAARPAFALQFRGAAAIGDEWHARGPFAALTGPARSATVAAPILELRFPPMLALAATLAIQALVSMAVLTPPVFAPLAAPAIGVAASETGIFMAFAYGGASVASMASGALLRRFGA